MAPSPLASAILLAATRATTSRSRQKNDGPELRSGEAKSVIPDRLETQIQIPPGIYELRAIFSDGGNFGRKRVPLTIEPYGAKQLALSQQRR
jgi:hypothetical protein